MKHDSDRGSKFIEEIREMTQAAEKIKRSDGVEMTKDGGMISAVCTYLATLVACGHLPLLREMMDAGDEEPIVCEDDLDAFDLSDDDMFHPPKPKEELN